MATIVCGGFLAWVYIGVAVVAEVGGVVVLVWGGWWWPKLHVVHWLHRV
ncbi:hypothetical protein Hanom_Chr13g01243241 [Helianthus anomalus]